LLLRCLGQFGDASDDEIRRLFSLLKLIIGYLISKGIEPISNQGGGPIWIMQSFMSHLLED